MPYSIYGHEDDPSYGPANIGDPINLNPLAGINDRPKFKSRRDRDRTALDIAERGRDAMSTKPLGHWTQALAQVLEGGVAGYDEAQLAKDDEQRRSYLAAALEGGQSPQDLMEQGALYDVPELSDIGEFQARQADRQADRDYRTGRDTVSDEHWQKDFAADEAYRNRPDKPQRFRVNNDLVDENGNVVYHGEAKPTRLTADQANAAGYYDRAVSSDAILGDPKIQQAALSLPSNAASNIPLVGNYLTGKDFQKYDQARRDFINAVLRKESGAAISPSEFANANIQYFPQPGDEDDVLKQKAANRKNTINALKRSSGSAFDNSGGGGDPLDDARQAIQNGADPEAVRQRLIDNGIDPSGLD